MYVVKFTDGGLADVKALPKNFRNVLKKQISANIAKDPYGCSRELHEPLEGWRSAHCQGYRVVFKVYDDLKIIAIAGVGKRSPQSQSDIYRKLEALATEGKLAERVLGVLRGFSGPTRTK